MKSVLSSRSVGLASRQSRSAVSAPLSSLSVCKRWFGMKEVRAWIKKQETLNYEKRLEAEQTADRLRAERESPLFVSRQWRPNEQLDGKTPIKIPNISLIYSTNDIQNVVENIDMDSEADIEDDHPFDLYSLLVIERVPIIRYISAAEEEYKSALRAVKLSQNLPELMQTLYVDKCKRLDAEMKKNTRIRPRVTADDLANELHSLNRCLDRRLYLITKLKQRDHWEFPWAKREFDETMMESAQRALADRIGTNLEYSLVSHEPFGHVESSYPEDYSETTGKQGAQVFFHKGYYMSGNGRPNINPDIVEDFAWVPKSELPNRINPELYQSISPLLLD